jgi:hypothetical protein
LDVERQEDNLSEEERALLDAREPLGRGSISLPVRRSASSVAKKLKLSFQSRKR